MDERMTLEMVRDGLRNNAADLKRNGWLSLLAGHLNKMADAIDAHLAQPAQAVDCPACEGRPASGNSPCHVCGKSAQADGWTRVGTLTLQRWKGIDSMLNADFDYAGDLPDGDYQVFVQTPPQTEE